MLKLWCVVDSWWEFVYFLIFATHHICRTEPFFCIVARKVCLYHLMVIVWAEEGGLQESRVVEGWGSKGRHIGSGSSRLGIPPVTLRMCREVIWSGLCPLPYRSLEGGSGPAWLGVRVMGKGQSMRYRCPQRCLHCRWGQSLNCEIKGGKPHVGDLVVTNVAVVGEITILKEVV